MSVAVDDYGGIIPQHEIFYIRAVLFAASKGIEAFENYSQLLANVSNLDEIVFELQEARGRRLVAAFGVLNNNPVCDRRLRNAIEHYDERLDKFLVGEPTSSLIDLLVGNYELADQKGIHVLRTVDPENCVFVLFGEEYRFNEIEQAVVQLRNLASFMVAYTRKVGPGLNTTNRKSC